MDAYWRPPGEPTADSHLTVYRTAQPVRCLEPEPRAEPDGAQPGLVKVGAGGKVAVYNAAGSTNVILDVVGWCSA